MCFECGAYVLCVCVCVYVLCVCVSGSERCVLEVGSHRGLLVSAVLVVPPSCLLVELS